MLRGSPASPARKVMPEKARTGSPSRLVRKRRYRLAVRVARAIRSSPIRGHRDVGAEEEVEGGVARSDRGLGFQRGEVQVVKREIVCSGGGVLFFFAGEYIAEAFVQKGGVGGARGGGLEAEVLQAGLNAGGRRLEFHPTVFGEVDFRPGVVVLGADGPEVAGFVPFARSETDHQAGGDVEGAEHGNHGGGEVGAEADALIG